MWAAEDIRRTAAGLGPDCELSVNGGEFVRGGESKEAGRPGAGHNSGADTPEIGGIAAEALQQYVDRIEHLEEEKKALSEDIKQVYSEAKSNGFDVKILRKIISLRKVDENDRKEQEEILELYKIALGME
jgi:uncharacterized protein (UPF0335 family)